MSDILTSIDHFMAAKIMACEGSLLLKIALKRIKNGTLKRKIANVPSK